jgi:hypothetical protein
MPDGKVEISVNVRAEHIVRVIDQLTYAADKLAEGALREIVMEHIYNAANTLHEAMEDGKQAG